MSFPRGHARYVLADSNPHKMGQDWTRYQRMIHHQQLRYELLRNSATQYDIQTGAPNIHLRSAFRNIEQVLRELYILQRKYILHLNPSELDLPFIRFLLKWSFNTRGKAKLNALLQELQGYYDTIERVVSAPYPGRRGERALPHSPQPHDSGLLPPRPHLGSRPAPWEQDVSRDNSGCPIISPSTRASELLSSTSSISHQPGTNTHFSNYSNHDRPNHQASLTGMGRPTSISYTRASTPTPTKATDIASWFGSTRTYRSRERDDNCSGPLHREYSSSSSRG